MREQILVFMSAGKENFGTQVLLILLLLLQLFSLEVRALSTFSFSFCSVKGRALTFEGGSETGGKGEMKQLYLSRHESGPGGTKDSCTCTKSVEMFIEVTVRRLFQCSHQKGKCVCFARI